MREEWVSAWPGLRTEETASCGCCSGCCTAVAAARAQRVAAETTGCAAAPRAAVAGRRRPINTGDVQFRERRRVGDERAERSARARTAAAALRHGRRVVVFTERQLLQARVRHQGFHNGRRGAACGQQVVPRQVEVAQVRVGRQRRRHGALPAPCTMLSGAALSMLGGVRRATPEDHLGDELRALQRISCGPTVTEDTHPSHTHIRDLTRPVRPWS